jgi:hypothetical protein
MTESYTVTVKCLNGDLFLLPVSSANPTEEDVLFSLCNELRNALRNAQQTDSPSSLQSIHLTPMEDGTWFLLFLPSCDSCSRLVDYLTLLSTEEELTLKEEHGVVYVDCDPSSEYDQSTQPLLDGLGTLGAIDIETWNAVCESVSSPVSPGCMVPVAELRQKALLPDDPPPSEYRVVLRSLGPSRWKPYVFCDASIRTLRGLHLDPQ